MGQLSSVEAASGARWRGDQRWLRAGWAGRPERGRVAEEQEPAGGGAGVADAGGELPALGGGVRR